VSDAVAAAEVAAGFTVRTAERVVPREPVIYPGFIP
jgi:hypothetical protein